MNKIKLTYEEDRILENLSFKAPEQLTHNERILLSIIQKYELEGRD